MAFFLSYTLSENTPGYGGKSGFTVKVVNSISQGKTSNTKELTMSNHIGTHIDAPNHFFEDGKSLDQLPAEFWIFNKPFLIEIPCEKGRLIEWEDKFDSIPMDADILLIKTGFGQKRGDEQYWKFNPGLSPALGITLRKERPALEVVGMDFISISMWQDRQTGRAAHRAWLDPNGEGNPLLLVEDMNLLEVNSDTKFNRVTIMPLMFSNADGSPVTIVGE